MRSTSERSRKAAEEGIHRVAYGIAQAHGVEATVQFDHGYPVTIKDGKWTVVEGLQFDDFGKAAFKKTLNELLEEKDAVKDLLA